MDNKISEFYAKVIEDETLKAKFEKILAGKDITEASDNQLKEIGEISKEMDYNFTLAEVKEFIETGDVQLSDDALDNVAGGKGEVICSGPNSGQITTVTVNVNQK